MTLNPHELYTVNEVAAYLRLTHRTVRRYITQGRLVAIRRSRVHGLVRITGAAVLAFMGEEEHTGRVETDRP